MFYNYFKIAIRNLLKYKVYSFINIGGLAIGMTACILILLFIQSELSFDTMHKYADRTYRVLTIDNALGTNNQRVGITMPALGPAIVENFPEAEVTSRLTFGGRELLQYGDNPGIYSEQLRMSDPNFFDMFDFPMIDGDPATALAEPYSIVLTEKLADKIFGEEDALGKTLKAGSGYDFKVTGIMKDLPLNTHIQLDAVGSISTFISEARLNQPEDAAPQPVWVESWRMIAMPTYLRLKEGVSPEGYAEQFTKLSYDNGVGENFVITLQPLLDVHLRSTNIIFDTVQNKGDINNIYTFAAIALLILIIATVNYLNLSTARSAQRAREVGLRKVVGSLRGQMIIQFLGESILITFTALILSIPLVETVIPWLNDITNSSLSFDLFHNGLLALFMFSMLIIVGVLAGLYPAIVLTKFEPITVLKGNFKTGNKGTALRKSLVVIQFALSIALISLTMVVQRQMRYITTRDIGYTREHVMIVDMYDNSMSEKLAVYRDEILTSGSIESAAIMGNVPGRTFGRARVRPEGASDEDIWIWSVLRISPESIPTLGMKTVMGRNFEREMTTDTSNVVIINETAAKKLGWNNPLGKTIRFSANDSLGSQVIGVVKDFNYIEMHQNIEPVLIAPLRDNQGGLLAVRIKAGQIPEAIKFAEEKWSQVYPDHPFKYSFMDDEFENIYRRDINVGKIVNVFASLAIFVACLGLLGLASHATTQRTKEIGVRKVMGASAGTIVKLLVIDFVKWVVIANVIACPIAWYAGNKWLANFAYRVDIDPSIFIISGFAALIVAMLTVLSQTWRAALLNPVVSLRTE